MAKNKIERCDDAIIGTKNRIERCGDMVDRISIAAYEKICRDYAEAIRVIKAKHLAMGEPVIVSFRYKDKVYQLVAIGSGCNSDPYVSSEVLVGVVNEAIYIDASTGEEKKLGAVLKSLIESSTGQLEPRVLRLEERADTVDVSIGLLDGRIAKAEVDVLDVSNVAHIASDNARYAIVDASIARTAAEGALEKIVEYDASIVAIRGVAEAAMEMATDVSVRVGMYDVSIHALEEGLEDHVNDTVVHVTAHDKEVWNHKLGDALSVENETLKFTLDVSV